MKNRTESRMKLRMTLAYASTRDVRLLRKRSLAIQPSLPSTYVSVGCLHLDMYWQFFLSS